MRIITFLLGILFSLNLYGISEIQFISKNDFQKCSVIGGQVDFFRDIGYGISFNPKSVLINDVTDLFLIFPRKELKTDKTGHYSVKYYKVNEESPFQTAHFMSGGFIKPFHKVVLSIKKNNFLSNVTDMGSFSFDFFIYPCLLNKQNIIFQKGIYLNDKFYGIRVDIINNRIRFNFENFFYYEDGHTFSINIMSDMKLRINEWQHIGLVYNRAKNKFSLFMNGEIDSEKVLSSEQVSGLPHFHRADGSDLVLFEGLKGYVDNFRILRTAQIDYKDYLNSFDQVMEITSPLIDLKYINCNISRIRYKIRNIEEGIPEILIKSGNTRNDLLKHEWSNDIPYETVNDELIMKTVPSLRFLQWKLRISRNMSASANPILHFFSVEYKENKNPLAPAHVTVERVNKDSIQLKWDYNFEDSVLGYIIYWGTKSGEYENKLDIGFKNSYIMDSLNEGENYYFSIKAYNHKEPYQLSGFSKEIWIFYK
ncbi:MAG: fibronectin type III domain-containing protein [bacterium]|nr:fibronectin type III domain-containing protein [bacterium]